MNPLMEQLHDIEGLDPISPWPLAVGWWIVLATIMTLAFFLTYYLYKKHKFKNSWKSDALKQLLALEKKVRDETLGENAIALSSMIRRIAILRYSRKECAGLTGSFWLHWLSKHDPSQFDWENKGKPLIEAPYTPRINCTTEQIKELIRAIKGWIH